MMEKVELKDFNVVREFIKNKVGIPEQSFILEIQPLVINNFGTIETRVIPFNRNNEGFYLEKSVRTEQVSTVVRNHITKRPEKITAVVERFNLAVIQVKLTEESKHIIMNGIYKWKGEFFIPCRDGLKHLLTGKVKDNIPINECVVYGGDNGHCSVITTSGMLKSFAVHLYATQGVSTFNNADWSADVHCGMYEELLKEELNK